MPISVEPVGTAVEPEPSAEERTVLASGTELVMCMIDSALAAQAKGFQHAIGVMMICLVLETVFAIVLVLVRSGCG